MKNENLNYQIAVTQLHGIGPRKANILISKLGGVEPLFTESLNTIHCESGISKSVLRSMKREQALAVAEKQIDFIEKNGINCHYYYNTNYPRRLRQCPDAPLMLYSKGNFEVNPPRSVAVVGTRSATEYGRDLCLDLIDSLEGIDLQVVSGLAYGIDVIAHQQCLKRKIETIGVLGHGLDRIYPNVHRKISESMMLHGGVLTEFLPGTLPDRENFPMRNRIVAGMTDATIVIESKITGGSLITAELAVDYNKDVFAFPGNVGQVQSEGCNQLIKTNKAQLITNANDFLSYMSWQQKKKNEQPQQRLQLDQLNSEEKELTSLLMDKGQHIDTIALQLKKPVSQISVLLLTLEIKGIIKSLPGNMYGIA